MIEQQPFELSKDFQYVLNLLEKEGKNVFITGRAGTGKSTLLQLFRQTTRKKIAVLAPTGVAALNVKGQTIHSFFRFPPKPLSRNEILKRRDRRLYQNLDMLIIDEISMVRADLLDQMDYFLRINREKPQPFGGLQMVFFGDLFQLPPVVGSEAEAMRFQMLYDSPYFFSAHVLQEGFEWEGFELKKVYRQENRHFLRLLDAIRINELDYDDLDDLNRRYLPNFQPTEPHIILSARNASVDRINRLELEKIPLEEKSYRATIKGDFNEALFPTEANLRLKVGAQVMFLKNDPDGLFVNGTIGQVRDLKPEQVIIQTEQASGKTVDITLEAFEWEIVRYKVSENDPDAIETEVIGSFKQLPLKLAWVITIHKSQGKTFDRAIIDLGKGAFEHGQTYVALSRCRTLEGIVLQQPIRHQDVLTDERVIEFYQRWF
ncbi:MAG TPA: AAA family ATPase [Saprospiraceae bacterium]|nr:AAA family ATPase [Saprospiraceae bacterium]HMQ85536.1 AAA family ATPase [Saprospiraceae bacterium]